MKSVQEYERFANQANLHSNVVRRDLLRRIAEAASTHRVVVVTGEGGDGKTVALSEWARGRLNDTTNHGTAFTAIILARELGGEPLHGWLRRTLGSWAGATEVTPYWPAGMPLAQLTERVQLAQKALGESSERPVALVCDGFDEAQEGAEQARRLVRETGLLATGSPDGAQAVLVLTSRASDEIDAIVAPNPRGSDVGRPLQVMEVRAGPFTPEELEAAGELLAPGLGGRLRLAVDRSSRVGTPDSFGVPVGAGDVGERSRQGDFATSSEIPQSVAEALSHPAMWEAFSTCAPDMRALVLRGEKPGLHHLAFRFVSWSLRKWKQRRAPSVWPGAAILTTITSLSQRHGGPGQAGLALWSEATTAHGGVTALEIWRELQSSGVIRLEGTVWWWRHAFVGEYLATDGALASLREFA